MFHSALRLIFLICFISAASLIANAQVDKDVPVLLPPKEELPKGIKESIAKGRIEREKKDFAELLERGEEAIKLSDELEKSFAENNRLSTEDQKKLERLEKLYKKIRSEIGGKDDNADDESKSLPSTTLNALKSLHSNTLKLVDELKKTSRYSVSVIAVESSNLLLKVIRFLRFKNN